MRTLFILALGVYGAIATARVDVRFSPNGGCEAGIINMIDYSRHDIKIAIYSITNRRIQAALENARRRGVKVKILADRLQGAGRYSIAPELYQAGFNIKLNSFGKIEHNKFLLVDWDYMSTGSYNWSKSAEKDNSENCMFLFHEPVIQSFHVRFDELWAKNSREKSDAHFQKIIRRRASRQK